MYCPYRFNNRELAEACVDYINQELTLPQPGTVLSKDGEYHLQFGGLENYQLTREKLYNTVLDFRAGWIACNLLRVRS